MHTFYSVAIFSLSNSLFFLFWWSKIEGKFNTADLGILLTVFTLFVLLLRTRERRILFNPISFLLVFQLLFCLFHIIHVVDKFNYSFFNAAVASRSFLYYLSFFVFLLLFDTREKVVSTMRVLNWVMLGILVLSLVNYFGPVIFHHEWAAGHSVRAGIKRAFIPGPFVVSMVAIWSFACMYASGFTQMRWGTSSMAYVLALVFQQSRMNLMGVLAGLFGMGIQQRRYVLCLYSLFLVSVGTWMLSELLEVDILGENIRMTITDISQSKGTYSIRMAFLRESFAELMASPIVGTGGSAIRAFKGAYEGIGSSQFSRFYILGKQTDIGIFNWIKDFGVIGLVWAVVFFGTLLSYARHVGRNPGEDQRIYLFSLFYLVFVLVTSLTIEHLINSIAIPPLMLASALLVRMRKGWSEDQEESCAPPN